MSAPGVRARESGDRHAFLARAEVRAAAGPPANVAHPLTADGQAVSVVSSKLDPNDLVGSFVANAEALGVTVHHSADDAVLREIIAAHDIRRAVHSRPGVAREIGSRLAALGVDVAPYDRETGALADLGVTCPVAALATTGSLVQDCSIEGSRGASLLPRVHLALVSRRTIVASTTDVLRDRVSLPSNLVFITGPSRTGDIEMIITVGVHGPVAVHVALTP